MWAYKVAIFGLLIYVVYLDVRIKNLEELAESHAQDLRILDGRTQSTDEYLREREKYPSWMLDRLNHGDAGVHPAD